MKSAEREFITITGVWGGVPIGVQGQIHWWGVRGPLKLNILCALSYIKKSQKLRI